MRKVFCATLAALAVLCTAEAKEIVIDGPRIEFEKTTFDFGTLPQFSRDEHVFKFRNAGNKTLKIGRVHASCGCTAALLSDKEIEPGKTGEVQVTFKSQDFSGKVSKHVDVYSNDPVNKMVRLKFTANVLADVACSPKRLNFGRIASNEPRTLTVKVFSPSSKQFTIESAKPSADFIKTEIIPAKKGELNQHTIKISLDGVPPSGRFRESVVIKTSLGEKSKLPITVEGYRPVRTEILPPKLFFGVVGAGEQPERSIVVRANAWKGLKIEKVETPNGVSATTSEVKEGEQWTVSVRLDGPFETRLLKARIKIFLNDPQMKTVEVKLSGLIQQKK